MEKIDTLLFLCFVAMAGWAGWALIDERRHPVDKSASIRLIDGRSLDCHSVIRYNCGFDIHGCVDGSTAPARSFQCVQGVEIVSRPLSR